MELIHRKYALSKDSSGKKWFEMQRELANCRELLGEWKLAKEYYEESNISGLNDANIARCLARMEETDAAVDQFSAAIENKVFTLVSDLMQVSNLWVEKEDTAKAIATYQAAIAILDSFHAQMDLKVMKLSCHFALACLENENDNEEAAKEQVRLAVRTETGRDLSENNTESFLQAKKPHQLIHTAFEGSQVVQMLTAMGEEELLSVAQEELNK
jgi:tetratricopeptide (TPR) repeat protein